METVKFENTQDEYGRLLNFLKLVDTDFYPPLSERGSLKEYLDAIINDGVIIYLEDRNKIVGMIGYCYFSKEFNSAYINTVAILKEFRGRGLGKLLLKKCFSDLRKKHVKKVKIRTWSINKISIRLYKKIGFKVFKIVKNDRGPSMDSIYFEKSLT